MSGLSIPFHRNKNPPEPGISTRQDPIPPESRVNTISINLYLHSRPSLLAPSDVDASIEAKFFRENEGDFFT